MVSTFPLIDLYTEFRAYDHLFDKLIYRLLLMRKVNNVWFARNIKIIQSGKVETINL
jgi:hypothetical protein